MAAAGTKKKRKKKKKASAGRKARRGRGGHRPDAVGAYMSRAVVTVETETPLTDVCRLMNEDRISCVVVRRGRVPVGLISERAVVRRIAQGKSLDVAAGRAMSRPLLTVTPRTPVLEALRRMRENHVRRLVVVMRGRLVGIITQTDVFEASRRMLTEMADRQVRLSEEARRDDLTGLYNRRAFNGFFRAEAKRVRRYGGLLALVLLDLDHFKRVNDVHGHDAGDEVLRDFARVLRENCREVDLPARYGGEEFAVLMPAAGTRAARLLAERVRRDFGAIEFREGGVRFGVTVSAGVCKWTRSVNSPRAMLRRADAALYAAKHAGRNRVRVAK